MTFKDLVPLEQFVNVTIAALERTAEHRRQRRRSTVFIAIAVPLFIAMLMDAPLADRVLVAGVCAVVLPVLYPRYLISAVRRRLRKHYLGALGSAGPYEIVYKIDPESIEVDHDGFGSRYPWNKLVELKEDEHYFDLAFEKANYVRVAKRAFESDAQRREFFSLAASKQPVSPSRYA